MKEMKKPSPEPTSTETTKSMSPNALPVGDSVFLGLLISFPVSALIGTCCYAFWEVKQAILWAVALVLLLTTLALFLLRKPFAVLGMWLSLLLWLGLSVMLYVGWCGYSILNH